MSTGPWLGYQSGATALIIVAGDEKTRSGLPMLHFDAASNCRAGGRSAGLPLTAPLSTHLARVVISSSVSDGSSLYFLIPTFFSMNQGGISWSDVRCLIALAQGRASSYVIKDIGAIDPG